jgi:hypothetical protein
VNELDESSAGYDHLNSAIHAYISGDVLAMHISTWLVFGGGTLGHLAVALSVLKSVDGRLC